jgi:hypothetical protein
MVDGHASVNAFPCEILLPNEVSGRVGYKEYRVDALGGLNHTVQNIESVTKTEGFSGREVRSDLGLVNRWLGWVS